MSEELKPVAWIDDGSIRSGSHTTSHRVITDDQKQGMPDAVRISFSEPLYDASTITALTKRAEEAERERDAFKSELVKALVRANELSRDMDKLEASAARKWKEEGR